MFLFNLDCLSLMPRTASLIVEEMETSSTFSLLHTECLLTTHEQKPQHCCNSNQTGNNGQIHKRNNT